MGRERNRLLIGLRIDAGRIVLADHMEGPNVQHNHGGFAFADTRAHGLGDQPHHVYSVRFEARELWGADAEARDAVYIDLWEPYIEPAA